MDNAATNYLELRAIPIHWGTRRIFWNSSCRAYEGWGTEGRSGDTGAPAGGYIRDGALRDTPGTLGLQLAGKRDGL